MNFKTFKTFGARCPTCQVDRIDNGFIENGLQYSDKPDFIYSNDFGSHEEAIHYKKIKSPNSKLILNVLDIPIHLGVQSLPIKKWKSFLEEADSVTSISLFVKNQVKEFFGINSEVIYQPIMPTEVLAVKDPQRFKYLFVGRKYDTNKNVSLGIQALYQMGVPQEQVGMIGPEFISWGTNLGLISQEDLNYYYNHADFSFSLGEIEGLNLPVIESMSVGCIPIVLKTLTTREELLPSSIFPHHKNCNKNIYSIIDFINITSSNLIENKNKYYNFYINNLKDKFKEKSVALAIISSIKNV